MRKLSAVLAGVILAVGWPAGAASAHAALKSATPADGSVLRAAPSAVVLRFNEKLQSPFTTIRLTEAGSGVTAPAAGTKNDVVTQPLPADLPSGAYTVAYRVVSADGHPISGRLTFTVDAPAAAPSASAAPSAPASSAPPAPSAASSPDLAAPIDAAPAGAEQSSGTGWGWLVVGAVVVVLLVGGVLLLGRRRSAP